MRAQAGAMDLRCVLVASRAAMLAGNESGGITLISKRPKLALTKIFSFFNCEFHVLFLLSHDGLLFIVGEQHDHILILH